MTRREDRLEEDVERMKLDDAYNRGWGDAMKFIRKKALLACGTVISLVSLFLYNTVGPYLFNNYDRVKAAWVALSGTKGGLE